MEQAYRCFLAHSYAGPVIDDRVPLAAAFGAAARELRERGVNEPGAVLPPLTGDRDRDWTAFARRFGPLLDALPDRTVRSAVAVAAIRGMAASLHDDHVVVVHRTSNPTHPPGHYNWGFGFRPSELPEPNGDTSKLTDPPYLSDVGKDTPASRAGLRTGDVLLALNGVPMFTNGIANAGQWKFLDQGYPQATPVRFTVRRPTTGKDLNVTVKPGLLPIVAPPAQGRLVADGIAEVPVTTFQPGGAQQALTAIAALTAKYGHPLKGVILDLRDNAGGMDTEVSKLLGAFVHGKTYSSFCDVRGACRPQRTDDSTPLLNAKLVALIGNGCASACDAFAMAVKDLRLGTLVGDRTRGVASGGADAYSLDDNATTLMMPATHALGANGEIFDGIGVPADYRQPLTPLDVATGKDPAVAKAVTLLTH
ncbi:S41 family peptidase [Actinomadura rupiterrae]|uniref:S41 family peptidase n=1 Tax=Actinomadura rupiterrae TaxID=559627 RepID=UPI0020A5465F|nr:S41 family peptidase [Actinomadura rupiterrae]MCP2338980.1 carboxyl-terminal processing protease [Actinomadura rupiterrae]